MMHTTRVKVADLTEERFDANYYAPLYLANAASLATCGFPLSPVGRIADRCNCGATPKLVEYNSRGIGLIRTADVRPNYFGTATVLRTLDLKLKPNSSVEAKPGDMVYTMSGTIGHAAVIPCDAGNYSFSNTIARVRLPTNTKNDIYYVSTFFNSHRGFLQSLRLVSGGIQGHVMPNPFKKLPVPCPKQKAQSYIGDKVRQSELLRISADSLQSEATDFFSLPGMNAVEIGEFKSFRGLSSVLDSVRLDPKFYDPGHFKLRELLRPHQPISIGQVAIPVRQRWKREELEFFYLEIGDLDLSSGLVTPNRVSTVDAPSRATTLVKPGDVLISTVRPNRKNVGLVMEIDKSLPLVASSGFSVLRFASHAESAFYFFWLRSDAATMQLMRWDAGSSYPAIDEHVPLKVLVPCYARDVVAEKGARWHQSFQAQILAEKLTSAAKFLVEALIDGKVAEADLINAQELLECGNISADRALLSRLTRQGIDVPGQPPLFPDLDALYALLAQTQEELS